MPPPATTIAMGFVADEPSPGSSALPPVTKLLLSSASHLSSVTLSQLAVSDEPSPTLSPSMAKYPFAFGGSSEREGDASLSLHNAELPLSNYRYPFYSSTFALAYALAAATVTAYMLLIMLFVTPRSFLDGGVVYLGRRGRFTHSSSGGENIGGRPWLQKVAALTVAISLTLASYDSFRLAKMQYKWGAQNAKALQAAVVGSVGLRVMRLISNTFLWLAQAQTLIRLFPRHREKVIIKWAAFALITLDLIFSALNSFLYADTRDLPISGSFRHPIPALSYLLKLLLGVLYAAWVMYYSLMKKQYAFYHPLMKNMPLLAVISLISILIPVVIFILDICKSEMAGWGDYIRWVGAAAASVIVWEWVERIEALEREEKKGGILGREVFDGDEVLEVNASDFPWLRHRKQYKEEDENEEDGAAAAASSSAAEEERRSRGRGSGRTSGRDGDADGHGRRRGAHGGGGGSGSGGGHGGQYTRRRGGWPAVSAITGRQRGRTRAEEPNYGDRQAHGNAGRQRTMGDMMRPPLWPSRPAPTATSVSRTDTPSAASTVYAVRYQGTPDPSTRAAEGAADLSRQNSIPRSQRTSEGTLSSGQAPTSGSSPRHTTQAWAGEGPGDIEASAGTMVARQRVTDRWRALARAANPLSRRGGSGNGSGSGSGSGNGSGNGSGSGDGDGDGDGDGVRDGVMGDMGSSIGSRRSWQGVGRRLGSRRGREETARWDVRSRLELFAANQADKIREKLRPTAGTEDLPVTFIPAPPRRGAALQQVLEEEEEGRGELWDGSEVLSSADEEVVYSQESLSRRQATTAAWPGRRAAELPLPPNNPPLWPGVGTRRLVYEDEEEEEEDGEEREEDAEDEEEADEGGDEEEEEEEEEEEVNGDGDGEQKEEEDHRRRRRRQQQQQRPGRRSNSNEARDARLEEDVISERAVAGAWRGRRDAEPGGAGDGPGGGGGPGRDEEERK